MKNFCRLLFVCLIIALCVPLFTACKSNDIPPTQQDPYANYSRLDITKFSYQIYGDGIELLEIIDDDYRSTSYVGYGEPIPSKIIFDTIGGHKIKSIGANVFKGIRLTDIVFGQDVENIGDNAFAEMGGYGVKVKLNDGLKRIGYQAFAYCDIITLTIPQSVTNIGNRAFFGNRRLLLNMEIEQSRSLYAPYNFTSGWNDVPLIQWVGASPVCYDDGVFRYKDATKKEIIKYICQYDFPLYATIDGQNYLAVLVIPSSVETIATYAFPYSWGASYGFNTLCMGDIWIPASVTTIGYRAFEGVTTSWCEIASKPSGWEYVWHNGYASSAYFDIERPIGAFSFGQDGQVIFG